MKLKFWYTISKTSFIKINYYSKLSVYILFFGGGVQKNQFLSLIKNYKGHLLRWVIENNILL